MTKYQFEGKMLNTEMNRSAMRSRENLSEAKEKGQILESLVILCDKDHNLHVNLGCMKGIIPREEGAVGISDGSVRDIALISRVGKPVQFVIDTFQMNEYGIVYAVLSRKKVQIKCLEEYIAYLRPGDIIDAKITHLERFGAFVDMGAGVNSLIPIDMLSISRISHPGERVSEGDELRLVVRNKDNGKVTLSLREMLGTWEENAALFSVGETVKGIVRSVESYGVFIELTPNLAGLAEYTSQVKAGQTVSVYIKAVMPEKMKIKLSIISTFEGTEEIGGLKYYIGEDTSRLDYWKYSPDESDKLVETVF